MQPQVPCPPPRPISARAAENGLVISISICVLLILAGGATVYPMLSLFLWAGSLAMPVVLYRLMRRSYLGCGCSMSFVEVWAEGIASFFLGSLLPAVVAYLLLKFAFPDFIAHQYQQTIDTFAAMGTPEGDQWAATLQNIRSHGSLPGASDVAANIISFNIIVGTAIALFDTLVLRSRHRCAVPPQAKS